eukprot:scaffold136823_cov33-Tisochrysis_lutea.AAC.5
MGGLEATGAIAGTPPRHDAMSLKSPSSASRSWLMSPRSRLVSVMSRLVSRRSRLSRPRSRLKPLSLPSPAPRSRQNGFNGLELLFPPNLSSTSSECKPPPLLPPLIPPRPVIPFPNPPVSLEPSTPPNPKLSAPRDPSIEAPGAPLRLSVNPKPPSTLLPGSAAWLPRAAARRVTSCCLATALHNLC